MPSQKTSDEALARRDRMDRALRLRREGKKPREIADELGVDRSTVSRYLQDAIREVTREAAEDVLALTLERLDDVLAGAYTAAKFGDKDAAEVVLKVEDRRARLYGLYKLAEQRIKSEGRELSAVDAFHAQMLGGKATEDETA